MSEEQLNATLGRMAKDYTQLTQRRAALRDEAVRFAAQFRKLAMELESMPHRARMPDVSMDTIAALVGELREIDPKLREMETRLKEAGFGNLIQRPTGEQEVI